MQSIIFANPRRITEQNGRTPQIAENKTVSAFFCMRLTAEATDTFVESLVAIFRIFTVRLIIMDCSMPSRHFKGLTRL